MDEYVKDLRNELHRQIDRLFDMIAADEERKSREVTVEKVTEEEMWLSPAQASKLLGVAKSTFFTRVKEGILPKPVYFGVRSPRWKKSEIMGGVRK